MNGYFEEINKNKYLIPVLTNECKEIIQKYEELWRFLFKIRDLVRSITKNSDDYDEKYINIKFDLNDELLLSKTIEIHNVTIVVRSVLHDNNK